MSVEIDTKGEVMAVTGVLFDMVCASGLPLNQITATALVMTGAVMARGGSPTTREEWLLSCASVFDAAEGAAKVWQRYKGR